MRFGTIVCSLVVNQYSEFGNKIPSQCRDITDLPLGYFLAHPVQVTRNSASYYLWMGMGKLGMKRQVLRCSRSNLGRCRLKVS
jgi:hypothetical protein